MKTPKYTFSQLARTLRRADRMESNLRHKLARGKFGTVRAQFAKAQIAGLETIRDMISGELKARRVGFEPLRDCRPKRIQRQLGLLPAVS